MLKIHNFIDKR